MRHARTLILLLMAPLLALPGAASVHLCLCAWLGCSGVWTAESYGDVPDCCSTPSVAATVEPACPFCEEPTRPAPEPVEGPSFDSDCGNCRDLTLEGLEPFDGPLSHADLWFPRARVSLQLESERRWERCQHSLPVCRPPPRAVERGRGLPLRI